MDTTSIKRVVRRAKIIAIHTLIFSESYSTELYTRPLGLARDPKELMHKYFDTHAEMNEKKYIGSIYFGIICFPILTDGIFNSWIRKAYPGLVSM